MVASWLKTIQSVSSSGPCVLFLSTKQSVRPINSHDNATWKSTLYESSAGLGSRLVVALTTVVGTFLTSQFLVFSYISAFCRAKEEK